MKKHILLYALTLLLFGCGDPSETKMLRQYVEYTQHNDGMLTLYETTNHKKLDGFEESETIYIADMSHDV